MEKKDVFGSVSLEINAFDLLRIKSALKCYITIERRYCETLLLSDYEVCRLENLLHRVELLEKDFV